VTDEAYREPTATEVTSRGRITPQPGGYQRYMSAQGIPIHAGPGFRDVRELALGDWQRRGVRGGFLVLDQLAHLLGLFVIEIPPGGATEVERHLYEERYWVVEGEGTTEVFSGGERARRFEWHAGSLFSLPLNLPYRIVNGGDSRVVLISGNYAPRVLDIFEDADFVFGDGYEFGDRYDGSNDYFTPHLDTLATPEQGRALWRTSVIPDIAHCELPLDNIRLPGYRRIELKMSNGNFWGFIGEHPSGRYSRAHHHPSGAALLCVKGKGYTYAWPKSLGTTPWADGNGHLVSRVDYGPGGIVAAAPGDGDWFHQHFSTGAEPMRMLQFYGGQPGGPYHKYETRNGRKKVPGGMVGKGGNQIPYPDEDPHVRAEYERMLALEGVAIDMPDGVDLPDVG
jgi:quercetin dioxygenase-like cupin family protein